jgi:hypothetical protein
MKTTSLLSKHIPIKYVVDLLANIGSKSEKLAIDSVQRCFEEISLTRVFAVEKLQQLKHSVKYIDNNKNYYYYYYCNNTMRS